MGSVVPNASELDSVPKHEKALKRELVPEPVDRGSTLQATKKKKKKKKETKMKQETSPARAKADNIKERGDGDLHLISMPSAGELLFGGNSDYNDRKSVHFDVNNPLTQEQSSTSNYHDEPYKAFPECSVPLVGDSSTAADADTLSVSSSEDSSICSALSEMEENLRSMLMLDNTSEADLNTELLSLTNTERHEHFSSKLKECERILDAIHSWLKKLSVSLFNDQTNLDCQQCLIHCSSVISKKTKFPVGRRLNLSKP